MSQDIDLQRVLDDIGAQMAQAEDRGRLADYIPELAKQDPRKFGMSISTVDGQIFSTGDADEPFSIQSVSKVFALTMALGKVGDQLWTRVGREPSGTAFNYFWNRPGARHDLPAARYTGAVDTGLSIPDQSIFGKNRQGVIDHATA